MRAQVAAQNMPMASLIVGVDLVPIKPIRGVKTMLGDITTQVRAGSAAHHPLCVRAGCAARHHHPGA